MKWGIIYCFIFIDIDILTSVWRIRLPI